MVYSKSLEEHLDHLKQMLLTLRANLLFARRSKCYFVVNKVKYLGHFISSAGVSIDPHTIRQMRGFLGLAGYCRRFIKGYIIVAKPLTNILKKDGFSWSQEAKLMFQKLKNCSVVHQF